MTTYAQSLSENQRGELLLTDVAHQLTAGGGKPGQGYQAVLTSSRAEHRVKTCLSPDDVLVSNPENVRACTSSSPASSGLFDRDGFSGRTSPAPSRLAGVRDADAAGRFYAGIAVEAAQELAQALRSTSSGTSRRWTEARALAAEQHAASSIVTPGRTSLWSAPSCENSGTESHGGFSTAVSSECRSDADGCSSSEPSLSMILEPPLSVPARYSLSARAARGILRRAERRGRTLPSHLSAALETVARTTTTDKQAG
jgi:hypothetical protein